MFNVKRGWDWLILIGDKIGYTTLYYNIKQYQTYGIGCVLKWRMSIRNMMTNPRSGINGAKHDNYAESGCGFWIGFWGMGALRNKDEVCRAIFHHFPCSKGVYGGCIVDLMEVPMQGYIENSKFEITVWRLPWAVCVACLRTIARLWLLLSFSFNREPAIPISACPCDGQVAISIISFYLGVFQVPTSPIQGLSWGSTSSASRLLLAIVQ